MELQEYFYLIFYANPNTSRVKVFPDGEKLAMHLSSTAFIALIEETAGYGALPEIKEALNTYGVPWLFDRLTNTVTRLSVGLSNPDGIIEVASNKLKKSLNTSPNAINPADKYVYANTSSYIIENETLLGDVSVSQKIPEITVK